jgi:2-keto-4-pentenoate hydratase/2-oxohepta-3-ene-1,7-dioic acid hydratase in catechol pathway
MKLATVVYDDKERVGVVKDGEIIMIPRAGSMEELIRDGFFDDMIQTGISGEQIRTIAAREGTGDVIPLKEFSFLAPIPRPSQDVICLGMNFADHTNEAAKFHPDMVRENYAVYFSKRVNQAVPDGGIVDSHPDVTSQVDYEAEIAVIIGKEAYQVKKENARDYIFGYTILNDISAREVQTRHKQFYLGKSLDSFTPIGTWIVTADEFSYPPRIGIRSYVNGELRQDGNTADWIYGIGEVIEDLSAGMTLRAGTIISMGTPAGVGMGFRPPKYLKKGDVVVCEADGIGTLTSVIG